MNNLMANGEPSIKDIMEIALSIKEALQTPADPNSTPEICAVRVALKLLQNYEIKPIRSSLEKLNGK
jgi:hypothetical protein